jgi:hypothetical protein
MPIELPKLQALLTEAGGQRGWEAQHLTPAICKLLGAEKIKLVRTEPVENWDEQKPVAEETLEYNSSGDSEHTYHLELYQMNGVKFVVMMYSDGWGGNDDPKYYVAK